ncbi:hypothetical protein LJK87_29450 [Paenibacillus sp. P25]|nr:hypothetical protein LJK87_29450 [Paenibacillus sp. P25]
MPGSVHPRRLHERLGDLFNEPHHDDQVKHVDRAVKDHGPQAVQQMQVLNHHIFLYDPGLEDHDDNEENHDRRFADQVPACQHKGRYRREKDAERRADNRDKQRIQQRPADDGVAEHHLEMDQREALGHDIITVQQVHLGRIRERFRKQIDNRHEHRERDDSEHDPDRELGNG